MPPKPTTTGPITEGSTTILPIANNTVFYNPAQVFNRDLSILLLSVFSASTAGLHILEGLAASGLRSVRYAKEVKKVLSLTTNDLDATAVQNINRNFQHNSLFQGSETACTSVDLKITNADAIHLMRESMGKFNVIDLDPYGSASPFLDAAVSSVQSGGLLAVTSTDSLVLNGNNTGTCYLRYGGVAVKAPYGHELALRLLLGAIQSAGARHKRAIKVLASFSIDFYYRVFVQVTDDAQGANDAGCTTGLVFQCCQCENFTVCALARRDGVSTSKPGRLSPEVGGACGECGGGMAIGGPFFSGRLYDDEFVDQAIATVNDKDFEFPFISVWDKIKALLYGLREELVDVPLFYSLSALSNSAKLPKNIKLAIFRKQLKLLGFRVSGSHREPASIKTDAPGSVVYDVIRAFAKHIGFVPTEKTNSLAKTILAKGVSEEFEAKLDFSLADEDAARVVGVYLPNPQKNWGPKPAAKRRKVEDE